MSFLTEYFDSVDDGEEIAVCCPFPHYTPSGVAYQETNPSAHINTEKNVFHCFVCDKGYSETQFIEKILDCPYRDWETDRKSTRLNSSHRSLSRMPSSA